MATSKRAFSPEGIREKKEDYHGGCRYRDTSPDMKSKGMESLNVHLEFEEALRLATALQSAIMKLNRYDRRSKNGKNMGLCLSIKENGSAISVIEVPMRSLKHKS